MAVSPLREVMPIEVTIDLEVPDSEGNPTTKTFRHVIAFNTWNPSNATVTTGTQ